MTNLGHKKAAPGGFQLIKREPGEYLRLTLAQLVVFVVSLAPFLYALSTRKLFGFPRQHLVALSLACCLPLQLLVAMPFRYYLRNRLWPLVNGTPPTALGPDSYGIWFVAGLKRIAAALPFFVPLMAFGAAFYYYWNMAGVNDFWNVLGAMGSLIGGDMRRGLVVMGLLFILCLALAIYGWRRHLAFDYLDIVDMGVSQAWQTGRQLSSERKKDARRAAMTNALILIPAVLVLLVVLWLSLSGQMKGNLKMDMVKVISTVFTLRFSPQTLYMLGGGILVTYLPFLVARKLRLARVYRG